MALNTTKHIALSLHSPTELYVSLSLFEQGGFVVRAFDRFVDIVTHSDEALRQGLPLLIIASVQHGGLALTEAFRKRLSSQRIPIVMLDEHGDTRSAIRALQLGVMDYLTAAMDEDEIRQRVAHLHKLVSASHTFEVAPEAIAPPPTNDVVSFDSGLRAIRKGDMWVSLSPIEWKLFEELLQSRGRAVSFGDLVRRGLNRQSVSSVETSLLRLHMSRLRAKLQQNFGRELNIITLRGRGYMLA